ncbi:hypothetical protein [Clostridium ganghwense]|uniref:Peptidase propeptide and YPEB domain protein n=1 Tax=Clostridium ganghwense TaxID=312089 RepID=A0ABT4CNX3_9CLOT|nr:hypothetical protein [Clostridium ganghwense]MCY6369926.1 hypothetical protein [Clostridium ganghwense]
MKSKRIAALALLATLTIGGAKAFAQASNNTIQKNKLMTEKVAVQLNEKSVNTSEEKAVNAFEKYLDVKVESKDLKAELIEQGGEKYFLVRNKNLNRDKIRYTALIDTKTDKILNLECYDKTAKGDNKEFNLEEAKGKAIDFIKKNNLLDVNKAQFDEVSSKEVSKEANAYFMYFKYDNNKKLLVTLDKASDKVQSFIFLDEINSVG